MALRRLSVQAASKCAAIAHAPTSVASWLASNVGASGAVSVTTMESRRYAAHASHGAAANASTA